MIVVGLMSGTSVDGVDAAIVELSGTPPDLNVELLAFQCIPFQRRERERILALFEPQAADLQAICQMNFLIGEWFAEAALSTIGQSGMATGDIDLIASHGQTLFHHVGPEADVPSTLQIGEAAVIAARTGITTIADFRVADVAVGGQGAPLVSYVDWLLLRHPQKTRAIQNIGGIANVTYLPATAGRDDAQGDAWENVRAFDSGPGNMIIDYVVEWHSGGAQHFDEGGRLAERGAIDEELLEELLAHPYLSLPAPKTTGREAFGVHYAKQIVAMAEARGTTGEELVATVTAYTARSIAQAYRHLLPSLPDEVILGGGGAHNPALVRMLRQALPDIRILTHRDLGMDDDAKEALAFAVLGHECWYGRTGNIPACTQATRPVPLGKITPGANFQRLLKATSR